MSQRSVFRRHRQLAAREEKQEPESFSSPHGSVRAPASPTLLSDVADGAVEILCSKLRSLRLTELLRRAEDAGVDPDTLDEAAEASAEPKEAIVGLIVKQLVPSMRGVLAHALADADTLDTNIEDDDRSSITAQQECEHHENTADEPHAYRTSERRQSLVETMMRQFADDSRDDERYASDGEHSEDSLGSSSGTSARPMVVARRQRMNELSQPLPRHQQLFARRTQHSSTAWRPGGAAAATSRSDQDIPVPRTPAQKARTRGESDSWHVADCAARSAEQRLAQRMAQARSTPKEMHCGFGSSTKRSVVTNATKRRLPSHVLVTPPRPELTEPSRRIRSTPGACRAQEQRAFGSALSTHRGGSTPGETLLPWQRRNSQPSLCIESTTDARRSHRSVRQQPAGTPQPICLEVVGTVSRADKSSTSTSPTPATAPNTLVAPQLVAPQNQQLDMHALVPSIETATASSYSPDALQPSAQLSTESQRRRRRFLRALYDVQAESDDELSFCEGDLVILTAKPQPKMWMGYVLGARSKLGKFPTNAVRTMRSVCVAHDILPGTFITVALPKQSGTVDVLLPLGAKAGADIVFSLPSEASSTTDMNSKAAVRVAGEVVLPEDQEEQLELHARGVVQDAETKSSGTLQELRPSVAEISSSRVATSIPSSGLLSVKILELRWMKNGVLKKDDLPLRLLVGHTEKRAGCGEVASFLIREHAGSATMLVVVDGSLDGAAPVQASIELGTAVRSRISRSWHTLYCDSTEQKNHCLLHLELGFDAEAKFPDPTNIVSGGICLQDGNGSSPDQTESATELLGQDVTVAALADFCDDVDAASVLCLTGPQGGGKQHLVETFMKRWKEKLKDEPGVQSPALFICHVEMGSACVTSPRKLLVQMCAEMIRMQPLLLPCDLTGDLKKLVTTWVDLSRRLVAICDLPRGVKMLLPVTIWLPSDITSQACEEIELPALRNSAAKRLIQGLQSAERIEPTVEDSILAHPAAGSPLFTVLSCRVSVALGADVARTCRSVDELFVHCVKHTEAQLGRNVDVFLSLVATAQSVGSPLRSIELEALLEDIASQERGNELSARSPTSLLRVADLENTAVGCFISLRSDGGVMLCHDVIVAEVCTMYDLLPASPPDGVAGAESGTRKATELHVIIGDAFYSQTCGATHECTTSRSSPAQTDCAEIARAAEIAVIHRMCAGKWFEAWQCVVALQVIGPLRSVGSALTSTIDDLSSIIDGAASGLAEAKEALQHNRPQHHPHVSLSASA